VHNAASPDASLACCCWFQSHHAAEMLDSRRPTAPGHSTGRTAAVRAAVAGGPKSCSGCLRWCCLQPGWTALPAAAPQPTSCSRISSSCCCQSGSQGAQGFAVGFQHGAKPSLLRQETWSSQSRALAHGAGGGRARGGPSVHRITAVWCVASRGSSAWVGGISW